MKKADGWSMGQEEQKKKALEEKLRKRVYTAAFEAAQQRKEKPWQSWDEAFSERLAKQPFITEEERKPFAPSGAGAQCLLHRGKAAVAGFGGSVAGAGAPGRENPLGGAAGEPAGRRGGHAFGGAAPEHGAGRAGRGAACRAGAGRARLCA